MPVLTSYCPIPDGRNPVASSSLARTRRAFDRTFGLDPIESSEIRWPEAMDTAYFDRLRGWLCRVSVIASPLWSAAFGILAHAGEPAARRELWASDRFAAFGHSTRERPSARAAAPHRLKFVSLPPVFGRFAVESFPCRRWLPYSLGRAHPSQRDDAEDN